jgi:hypothetical protein
MQSHVSGHALPSCWSACDSEWDAAYTCSGLWPCRWGWQRSADWGPPVAGTKTEVILCLVTHQLRLQSNSRLISESQFGMMINPWCKVWLQKLVGIPLINNCRIFTSGPCLEPVQPSSHLRKFFSIFLHNVIRIPCVTWSTPCSFLVPTDYI